ncbi:unnamed protein product [Ilex paraguariensis]|uniref:Uncharacterized protein n=1 Tax=Ilex paraguariensis TaxID=185542 RepID=A0ABC8UR64_9AQUA
MAIFAVSLLIIAFHTVLEHGPPSMAWSPVISDGTSIYKTPSARHRKLLGRGKL